MVSRADNKAAEMVQMCASAEVRTIIVIFQLAAQRGLLVCIRTIDQCVVL